MKNNDNLEKSDKLIVWLIALCALMLFSWLVYDIAFLNPQLEGQIQIGKIYQIQNKVKRKFNKSLIWYAASPDELVYENDWIFTGSESIAKIKLDSGGEIVVEPDSLIVLSRKNGVLQLNLQHGRLLANVKQKDIKINVVRNGTLESVDTDKGIVSVEQDESAEEIDIDVIEEDKEDLTVSDVADRRNYKPQKGFTDIIKNGISARLYNYKNVKIFPQETAELPLDWVDPYNHWTNYEVEVAVDKDFKVVLLKKSLETQGYKWPVKKAAIYHWRIRGVDEDGKSSAWSENLISELDIQWIQKSAPLKLSKENIRYYIHRESLDQVLPDRSLDIPKTEKVNISWNKHPEATQYRLQTSNQEDFSDIREEKIIDDANFEFENLKLGKTFFRVIPENEKGFPLAEETKGQVITRFPPPDEETLKTIDKDEYQVMKWEPLPYAEAYEVTYRHDRNDEPIVEYVNNNRLKVDNKTGFLQWKVRVVEPETKKSLGTFSKTVDWYDAAKRLASLHGTGQAGKLYPVITKPEARKTFISVNNSPLFIVMAWTYEQEAQGYDVEISQKADMTELVYKKTVESKRRAVVNQRLKPGIYYMRVRAKHEAITDESWSKTEIFRVINREMK